MKINCPKCQFENQADSTRIVCARCATIIEVRLDQGSSADTNGKRQTARLPFGFSSGNNQGSSNNQQLNDVYATRLSDDFDDVLDIPRPEQPSYQSGGYGESPSVYDDVFASPSYDSSAGFEYSASDRRSSPLETFRPGASRQRESQEYINEGEPEFMGWPVLPDDSKGPDAGEKAFSPYDGLLTRLVSTVLIFGVIVAVAFYIVYQRPPETRAGNQKQPVPKEEVAKNEQPSSEVESKSAGAAEPKTQPAEQPARGSSAEKAVDIPPAQTRGVAENSQLPVIPNRGEWTIQIGSFSDQAQANERAANLRPQGISATKVVRVDLPGIGTRYRVYIGGFIDKNEATAVALKLRGKGVIQDYFVTKKS
ncbi:MAG: SPOR domain-containing protein [Blastocatellia bacterium]|nr:SPOR domain-containing protein [Blastocatellia bacterium]